jgi:hypothetical protein
MAEAAVTGPPSGLVLDRYRPLRPLGNGGSGSVWLARDETTGLDVALKIVAREGKAGPRAEREATVAAQLRHERCLRAYACASDTSHVYIAYEYAPGRTMREAMRAGELDDRSAVEAAAQILEGLAHAHVNGVVHRDVKPANVLLTDGDAVSVRLLDFGLARMEEAETLTGVGDVPGTLAYIPPERLAGEQSGPAGDVWAVGVLLWEALAGTHPFWASSLLETARAIEAGAPPLADARPDLPRRLTATVDAALALDPARRPSAARLAQALRVAWQERERTRKLRPRLTLPRPPASLLPAAGAALAAGWGAAALPFYPHGWAPALGALAFATTLYRERIGLALALAVPVLPLGNLSLGLAILYSAVALVWLMLSWREPRSGLAFALGPILAPLFAIALLPLALARFVGSPVRRLAQTIAAVAAAAVAVGLRGGALPFGAGPPPQIDLAANRDPVAVAGALWEVVAARPALWLCALALAAAAVAIPYVRGRADAAAVGAWLAAAPVLVAPHALAVPLVLSAWVTFVVLLREHRHA